MSASPRFAFFFGDVELFGDAELSEEAESPKWSESVSRGSDESGDTAFGWAASGSVAEAAPPPSGSGSEDSADPTSSGSEDVGASELEELSGLVSATEVSTIGLSLGASSGEGEAGGLAGELDMTEPNNYGHSECHQFLGSGRRRKHA